jgi:hypothetical protein
MYLCPSRSLGKESKRPEPDKIYQGWEPLVDDVCYLEVFMDALHRCDDWRPAWVVFLGDWHHGEATCDFIREVDAWIEANAGGRHRHTFKGIYEFILEEDARAFVARWGDVEPPQDDMLDF